jgi:hypothetical protein
MKTWNVTMDDVYVGMNDLNCVWTLYCVCNELYVIKMDYVIVNGLYVIVNGLYSLCSWIVIAIDFFIYIWPSVLFKKN